jgi:hypothetical protein
LRRLANDLLNDLGRKRFLPSRPRSVLLNTGNPILDKSLTPNSHSSARRAEKHCELTVLFAFGAQQDDLGSLYHTHSGKPPSREPAKLITLLL